MEVTLTEQGNLELLVDKWDMAMNLVAMGFSIALVIVVIVAAVKFGWRFWPWVLAIGLLAYILVN